MKFVNRIYLKINSFDQELDEMYIYQEGMSIVIYLEAWY
jgi:hypothetical protein